MKDKVFFFLTTIPKGKVTTYKNIAKFLGNENYARVVGNILHKNKDGNKYPCFKVVNSKGRLSYSYAFGGVEGQKKRLEEEGINVVNYHVDLNKYLFIN